MQNSTASRRGRSRSRQSQSRQSQASVSTKPRPIGTNFTINLPDGSRPTPWPLVNPSLASDELASKSLVG
eukprot:1390580-Amorphochlora_amoeboformis.AAC.1